MVKKKIRVNEYNIQDKSTKVPPTASFLFTICLITVTCRIKYNNAIIIRNDDWCYQPLDIFYNKSKC